MKRILSVLAVAALVVALMVTTAMPAFAQANVFHQNFGCNSSSEKCHENIKCRGFEFCEFFEEE